MDLQDRCTRRASNFVADKVHYQVPLDYASRLAGNPATRPAQIDPQASGKTFASESLYPKENSSPDPTTRITNDEI
jgi:hypothetical protein